MGNFKEVPTTWLWTSSALAVEDFWEVNEWMENLSFSLSSVFTPFSVALTFKLKNLFLKILKNVNLTEDTDHPPFHIFSSLSVQNKFHCVDNIQVKCIWQLSTARSHLHCVIDKLAYVSLHRLDDLSPLPSACWPLPTLRPMGWVMGKSLECIPGRESENRKPAFVCVLGGWGVGMWSESLMTSLSDSFPQPCGKYPNEWSCCSPEGWVWRLQLQRNEAGELLQAYFH